MSSNVSHIDNKIKMLLFIYPAYCLTNTAMSLLIYGKPNTYIYLTIFLAVYLCILNNIWFLCKTNLGKVGSY